MTDAHAKKIARPDFTATAECAVHVPRRAPRTRPYTQTKSQNALSPRTRTLPIIRERINTPQTVNTQTENTGGFLLLFELSHDSIRNESTGMWIQGH